MQEIDICVVGSYGKGVPGLLHRGHRLSFTWFAVLRPRVFASLARIASPFIILLYITGWYSRFNDLMV